MCLDPYQKRGWGWYRQICLSPLAKSLADRSKRCLFCGPFLVFAFCVYLHTVLSGPCSLVVNCWEKADLLALLCVLFVCVFVTIPNGVQGQVTYLIVSIPDICLLTYFHFSAIRCSSLLISMGLAARKPVFWVSDTARFKPACSAT